MPFVWAVVALLVTSGAAPASVVALNQAVTCEQTPSQDLLPDVVGPLSGSSPAWLVSGNEAQRWEGSTGPVKTLWVFARTARDVRVVGRRREGSGALFFQRDLSEPKGNTLVIPNPARMSVIPGGASPDVMRAYAFIPSYVFYPSPGCWEFLVRVGGDEVRIVREVKGR